MKKKFFLFINHVDTLSPLFIAKSVLTIAYEIKYKIEYQRDRKAEKFFETKKRKKKTL